MLFIPLMGREKALLLFVLVSDVYFFSGIGCRHGYFYATSRRSNAYHRFFFQGQCVLRQQTQSLATDMYRVSPKIHKKNFLQAGE